MELLAKFAVGALMTVAGVGGGVVAHDLTNEEHSILKSMVDEHKREARDRDQMQAVVDSWGYLPQCPDDGLARVSYNFTADKFSHAERMRHELSVRGWQVFTYETEATIEVVGECNTENVHRGGNLTASRSR